MGLLPLLPFPTARRIKRLHQVFKPAVVLCVLLLAALYSTAIYMLAVSVTSGDKAAPGKGLERNVTLNMNETAPPVLLSEANVTMGGGDAPSPPKAPTASTESENCPRCEDIFGKLRPSKDGSGIIQDVRMQVRRGAEGRRCVWPLFVIGVWQSTIVTSIFVLPWDSAPGGCLWSGPLLYAIGDLFAESTGAVRRGRAWKRLTAYTCRGR